jgi:hypothetical protein
MQHFSHIWLTAWAALPHCQRPRPKKTPATKPALESCFRKGKPFFEENAATLDKVEPSGANR